MCEKRGDNHSWTKERSFFSSVVGMVIWIVFIFVALVVVSIMGRL